ncbi:MAG: carbonic anhydrase [Campylobacterota bacterium]|jgi:carbonic anhydrase|nr:carbonic anhydrase [Campylobacterota bacterium]
MDKRSFLKFTALASGSLLLTNSAQASSGGHGAPNVQELQALAQKMIADVIAQNDYYVKKQGEDFFEKMKEGQQPRATVIGCSDSRFQGDSLDAKSENDLFFIRNIGNQFSSNMGSVEYGVRHLNTPLLMIIGHTRCGAVKAAMNDYSNLESNIINELDSILPAIRKTEMVAGNNELNWLNAVISNVHQQVFYAQKEFAHEVESGKLTIIGAVYDLANDIKHGHGRLKVVNLNGKPV